MAPGGTGAAEMTTVHATGIIQSDTDVKAADISLVTHPHGGVHPGTGDTSPPLPS